MRYERIREKGHRIEKPHSPFHVILANIKMTFVVDTELKRRKERKKKEKEKRTFSEDKSSILGIVLVALSVACK